MTASYAARSYLLSAIIFSAMASAHKPARFTRCDHVSASALCLLETELNTPMRRLTTDNLRLLAFHEAGHAVATWALTREAPEVALVAYDPGMTAGRMQVAHFTLDATPRHDAQVPHEAASAEGEPRQFARETFAADERRIIILMSGVEAESILTHDEDWWGSEEDRKRVEETITALLASGWFPAGRTTMSAVSCSRTRTWRAAAGHCSSIARANSYASRHSSPP